MNPLHDAREAPPRPPPIPADAALFLDVDGCLVEFADDPQSVRAPPRLLGALEAQCRRLDGALALVSGRTMESLDALIGHGRHHAAGAHGLEWRDRANPHPAIDPGLLTQARSALAPFPGALVEAKGAALALHWRAAPHAEPVALELAQALLPQLPGYRLQPGNRVIELRPAGADKGQAIRRFMTQPPFAGRRPVFAGDDLTDEAGFAAVNAMDGISVLVGDRDGSGATHRLADPAAVLAWLEAAP